ncbi:MAG: hypothetical protein KDC79_15870 [Cyclobacteriaceae bacterium]|nr:hypothetical protein [Cyclobacteriaceae bacterium]
MEIDILINYSETDNSSEGGNPGWVTSFEKFLQTILKQVLGANPTIVSKSDTDSLTKSELKNSATLISIVSNDMVKSGPCLDAVEAFYNQDTSKSRLFKVMKEHVDYEQQPQHLAQLIPYDLYDGSKINESQPAFYDYFGPEAEQIYWMKLVDLAYDINEVIHQLNSKESGDAKPLYERKSIYLATTGNDLTVQRNVIRRELQRHGFKVLPEYNLSNNLENLTNDITENLSKSIFSIHLLGSSYGDIPEGSDRSIVDLQNKIASQTTTSAGHKLQRLIWIQPDQSKSSERQRAFLENLQRDISTLEGAEVLQTPLEDFKNIMREEIFVNENFGASNGQKLHLDKNKQNVYLIYDKIDKEGVTPVIKLLVKEGFNVIEPDFEGTLLDVRRGHLEKLKLFDLAIVYQGKVNINWVRMKLLDLLKAPGLGRNKPIVGKAVIAGEGVEFKKELYEDFEVELIPSGGKKPDEKALLSFIKGLSKAI